MSNPSLNQIKRNIAKDNIIKDRRNLFRSKQKNNANTDKIIRDTRALFESDESDYYKPVKIGNAFSSNYIEYERNGDKNETISIAEYLDKIRPYLSPYSRPYSRRMENSINNSN